jgi:hypothetical protein
MSTVVPYQPQNLTAEQADGNICLTWQGSLGATSYQIQRSTDGVNFANLATATTLQYIDSLPGIGTMYYYQVAGVNGSGTGPYSSIAQMVAAPPAEMSLYELRLRCRQTADRVGSDFITDGECNAFIRIAMYELYDILITTHEDWFAANWFMIQTSGSQMLFPLPDGATNYLGGTYPNNISGVGSVIPANTPAPAFYKLAGVDLNVNTSVLTPSRVSLLRFDFIKRNQYVYPNSTSTIYGVYNMRYRLVGAQFIPGQASQQQQLMIIPTPAGSQMLLCWYTPKLPALLKDSDLTTIGTSGYLRYVIARTAKYMLDKEQEGANTDKLDAEILYLKDRIKEAGANRDEGIPDTISETRQDPIYGGTGFAGGSANGGW